MDIDELQEQFDRDGFLILRGVLSESHVAELREGVLAAFAGTEDGNGPTVRSKMFERGHAFEELIDFGPVPDIMERLVGADCHIIAQNALCTRPGQAIAPTFHADDAIRFPGIETEPALRVPCQVANCSYYLVDVDLELGPTRLIPGSHHAGRMPSEDDYDADGNPLYRGQSVVHAVGKAGDTLIWHDQVWHAGSENRAAGRDRLLQGVSYGTRATAQRFYPFLNYHMPEEILARANPRRQRLLGIHPHGAYG